MNASERPSAPIDALSTDGLEHLLQTDEMSPDVELSSPDLLGDMWTVDDAIKNLSITKRTVLRKLKNGDLKGIKIAGPYGPEWRMFPPAGSGDIVLELSPVTGSPAADHQVTAPAKSDLLAELKNQLAELKAENQTLHKDLQAANWRNGYLEAQTEVKDQQIKLLTDSQHKPGWWAKFASWFLRPQ